MFVILNGLRFPSNKAHAFSDLLCLKTAGVISVMFLFIRAFVIVTIVVIVIVIVNQTATALLWMMYHLGSYPDVQDQLYQEFERVVGKDGNITSNNIGKLSFLKACLKESMRYCV